MLAINEDWVVYEAYPALAASGERARTGFNAD
jgi:hypothetical protein